MASLLIQEVGLQDDTHIITPQEFTFLLQSKEKNKSSSCIIFKLFFCSRTFYSKKRLYRKARKLTNVALVVEGGPGR
jgi:hypothetical protein